MDDSVPQIRRLIRQLAAVELKGHVPSAPSARRSAGIFAPTASRRITCGQTKK